MLKKIYIIIERLSLPKICRVEFGEVFNEPFNLVENSPLNDDSLFHDVYDILIYVKGCDYFMTFDSFNDAERLMIELCGCLVMLEFLYFPVLDYVEQSRIKKVKLI